MIGISEHSAGCILPVRAQPRARKPGIQGEQGGSLKVAVSAAPEAGKANEAVALTLAEALGIKRHQIELLSGATSREKRFLISGLTPKQALDRLQAYLC